MIDRNLIDLKESDLDLIVANHFKNIPSTFFDAAWERNAQKMGEALTGKNVLLIKDREVIKNTYKFLEEFKTDVSDTKKQWKNKVSNSVITFLIMLMAFGFLDFLKQGLEKLLK